MCGTPADGATPKTLSLATRRSRTEARAPEEAQSGTLVLLILTDWIGCNARIVSPRASYTFARQWNDPLVVHNVWAAALSPVAELALGRPLRRLLRRRVARKAPASKQQEAQARKHLKASAN